MNPHQFSRRGFVSGLFAALTVWLCPRPRQIHATPRRPASTITRPPSEGDRRLSYRYDSRGQRRTTYEYDGLDRLTRVTEHPAGDSFSYESATT